MLTACPACDTSFELPDNLRGSNQVCPTCQRTFMALAMDVIAPERIWIVNCPTCQTEYEVDTTYIGDTVGCDTCNTSFTIAEPAAEAAVPLMMPGNVILDRYLVKTSWPGSIGPIYRVLHQQWELDVVIKTVRPGYLKGEAQVELFLDAIDDWVNLGQYPHIASCIDVRLVDDLPWLFIEYVNGGRLDEWIGSARLYHGSQAEILTQLLQVAWQVASALSYAHESGTLHGHISTRNIMMTKGGLAKVTDFGIYHARLAVESPPSDSLALAPLACAPGAAPPYCSIEQFENEPVTPQTDVWSWALIVLELFMARRSWEIGAAGDEACLDYLNSPESINGVRPPGAPELQVPPMPQELGDLLMRCFNRMPDDRPDSMRTIADRLATMIEQASGQPFVEQVPDAPLLRTNTLNNRAVAGLDWGDLEKAEDTWEQALRLCPGHPEATYNYLTHQWRQGRITDQEALQALTAGAPDEDAEIRCRLMQSLIHMERGDAATAHQTLSQLTGNRISPRGLRAALRRAASQLEEIQTASLPLRGHKGMVLGVAVSPDGRRVLTSAEDLEVRLWDLANGHCIRTLPGHRSPAETVAWSPNSVLAVSASSRSDPEVPVPTIRLWDVTSGNCLGTFGDFNKPLFDACFSANGQYVFCLAGDHLIRIWDLQAAAWVGQMRAHGAPGYRIVLDGEYLFASGHESGDTLPDLAKWEIRTQTCMLRFVDDEATGGAAILSVDGRFLFTARTDGTGPTPIQVWDPATGEKLGTLAGHPAPVRHFATSFDGSVLISIDADGLMRQWDVMSGKCIRSFQELNLRACDFVSRTAALPLAVLAGANGLQVELLGLPREQPAAISLSDHTISVQSTGDTLANFVSEIEEAIELQRYEEAHDMAEQILDLPEYADDRRFAQLRRLAGLHGRKKKLVAARLTRTLEAASGGIFGIHFSQFEEWALLANSDGHLTAWDTQTGELQAEWQGPSDRLQFIVFSQNGRHALSSHARGSLVHWDLQSGDAAQRMRNMPSPGTAIAISPDGRIGMAGHQDTGIQIWDLQEDRPCRLMHAHDQRITSLDISPDGLYALSGSLDNTIKLWELESGRCVRISEPLGGPVRLARFAADGRSAIVGIDFRPLLHWDFVHNRKLAVIGTNRTRPESVSLFTDTRWLVAAERGNNTTREQRLCIWQRGVEGPVVELEGLNGMPMFTAVSADGCRVLASSSNRALAIWELQWQYDFSAEPEWNDEAWAILRAFLSRRTPRRDTGNPESLLTQRGQPQWTPQDFDRLMHTLACIGHGNLARDDVDRRLTNLASIWDKPKSSLE